MACRDLPQVARAYQRAADELLEQALSKYEPHELDYPVLFLYRHTVEVYLKAALDKPPGHHDLSMLITSLEAESGKKLAPWVRDRLWDFHRIDKMAELFRYADPPADGELWIDLHQLRAVTDKLAQAIEQYFGVQAAIEEGPARRFCRPGVGQYTVACRSGGSTADGLIHLVRISGENDPLDAKPPMTWGVEPWRNPSRIRRPPSPTAGGSPR